MARKTESGAAVHYHAWYHPDDGSDGGKDGVLLRLGHPHRTRQSARNHGMKMPFFEMVMPCTTEHVGKRAHQCTDACPAPRRGGPKAG